MAHKKTCLIGDGGGPLVCPQPGFNFFKHFSGHSCKKLSIFTNTNRKHS